MLIQFYKRELTNHQILSLLILLQVKSIYSNHHQNFLKNHLFSSMKISNFEQLQLL